MNSGLIERQRPRRTQQQRRDTTTAALLAAAADAILESGPATSMSTIAKLAGVTKGALQHHFPSKQDLLVAVVADGWDDLVERTRQSPDPAASTEQCVRSLLNAMWASYRAASPRAAFMISTDPNLDEDLAAILTPRFNDARDRLDALWAECFADRQIDAGRLELARRFARSHLLGMLVQRQLPGTEPDPESELRTLSVATAQLIASSVAS